ncbi:MAG: alpha-galactosidase, partial [Chloroflexota bacterium]
METQNHSARVRARFTRTALLLLVCLALSVTVASASGNAQTPVPGEIIAQSGDAYIAYDAALKTWEIGSSGIRRRMDYRAREGFRLTRLTNKLTGREWLAPGSGATAELRMTLGGQEISGSAKDFIYKDYHAIPRTNRSLELIITLAHGQMDVHLHYVVFPGVSVIEQWAEIENTGATLLPALTSWEAFSVALRPSTEPLTLYWVQGLTPDVARENSQDPVPTLRLVSARIDQVAEKVIGSAGRSSEQAMGWFVLAAPALREGAFKGIEWSGDWQLRVNREGAGTRLHAGLSNIRVQIAPGEIFESPRRFFGFYRGDLDDAANTSHAFARAYLMRPRPADFPWTQFNTWFAFYTDIDEERLRREADIAAELGLEVFTVDAGWYEGSPQVADFSFGLGTWRENRDKFPSGLAAFSDYVHGKGMKFGLWVEPERVDVQYVGADPSPSSGEIPLEWLAYYDPNEPLREGAARTAQICLGNRAAREWVKTWLARLIRDYNVDWLKWDSNGWASCNPPGQPGDGDLAHLRGLYEIFDYLRAEFPHVIVENCASGGNRMDYGLLRRTDIAWLSDETDPSYRVRYHVTGASYPFPPEYLNSWFVPSYFEHLESAEKDPLVLRMWLRSRMMGAFGISHSMQDWSPEMRANVAAEIARYKTFRKIIAQGRQYHLLPQSDLQIDLEPPNEPDAAEFFDPFTNNGVVFLFRGAIPWSDRRVRLKGLEPDTYYQITSADGTISVRQT